MQPVQTTIYTQANLRKLKTSQQPTAAALFRHALLVRERERGVFTILGKLYVGSLRQFFRLAFATFFETENIARSSWKIRKNSQGYVL